ncbi:hypothetical protein GQR58_018183 [Nymphon striatum]|nr:hypothetical protein GQR58_018183 [Nymphon striatum]
MGDGGDVMSSFSIKHFSGGQIVWKKRERNRAAQKKKKNPGTLGKLGRFSSMKNLAKESAYHYGTGQTLILLISYLDYLTMTHHRYRHGYSSKIPTTVSGYKDTEEGISNKHEMRKLQTKRFENLLGIGRMKGSNELTNSNVTFFQSAGFTTMKPKELTSYSCYSCYRLNSPNHS